MRTLFFLVFSLVVVLLLPACSVEEAHDYQPAKIVLASDFLQPSDTLVFKDFERSSGIRVQIVHLSADSILKHFQAHDYNSVFDGVFLYSSYSLNLLSKSDILHQLPEVFKEQPIAIRSPKNDWIVLSFDPYVLQQADSGAVISTYNELTYGPKWDPVLTGNEQAAFEASVLHQFGRSGRVKSYTWLESMYRQMDGTVNDSLGHAGFKLNRFSKLQLDTQRFTVPNQVRGGTFYDGIGIGALRHSRNYTIVSELITYYLNPHYNQKLAGRLQTFPIESPKGRADISWQNDYPIFFRCSPNQCVRHYRDLERVRKKYERNESQEKSHEF